MDAMSNNTEEGYTFHLRRRQTRYLVGFEDLEPIVSDTIKNTMITTSKVLD